MDYINSRLKPDDVLKKSFGEVFTPIWFCEDIIDKIPIDWSNKDLKILEPSVGIGSFIVVLLEKLHNGLKDVIPDKGEREKHIFENMLYMIELNKDNVETIKYLFPLANVIHDDALKYDFDFKFDLIVGNPPFQNPNKSGGGRGYLWTKFVIKYIDCLKHNGFLSFIHPSGWRNVDGFFKKVQKKILSKQLLYLELFNLREGIKTFKCSTDYDYYVLQNTEIYKDTVIKFFDTTMDVNLKGVEFIPNGRWTEIYELINLPGERCEVVTDEFHACPKYNSIEETDTCNAAVLYFITQNHAKVLYCENKKKLVKKKKVMFSRGSCLTTKSIISDLYTSPFSSGIIDDEEKLDVIKEAFDNPEFRMLMNYCSLVQGSMNTRVLKLLPREWYLRFL